MKPYTLRLQEIIQQLMRIFIIVGYSEEEANIRTAQFLGIVEERVMEEMAGLLGEERYLNIKELYQASIDNSNNNSAVIEQLWNELLHHIDKEMVASIYDINYKSILNDYLSSIKPTLSLVQTEQLSSIVDNLGN